MAISSLGIGSGLDLNALVDGLVSAERSAAENTLKSNQTRVQTRLSGLGALQGAISTFKGALGALKGVQSEFKASSSNEDIIAVTVGDTVDPAYYELQVSDLAAAHALASDSFEDVAAGLGEGVLTLQVGAEPAVEIELAEGTNSLDDVRNAINDSAAGVNAVIVRDGDAYRLLLTSAETGAANVVSVTVDGSVDARLESAAMIVTREGADAAFTLNGLDLTSPSNVVDDVIPGVALTLKQRTEGELAVSVSIEPDHGGLREKLDELVASYNRLVDNIAQLGRYDPETRQAGPLNGDSTLRSAQSRIRGVFSEAVETELENNPFSRLLDIGLTTDTSGKVSLDAQKLDAALAEDEAGVTALVAAFATTLDEKLEAFTGTGGVLGLQQSSLNGQLKRLQVQSDALDRRMEQVESRLRAQFAALDTMVAQFNNTSAFLAQQLSALSKLTAGGSSGER